MEDYESTVRDRILKRTAKSLRDFGYPTAKAEEIIGDRTYREFLKRDLRDALGEDMAPTLRGILTRMIEECEPKEPTP